jgi:hypothetical protein
MKVTFRCLPELEGIAPEPRAARGALPDWLPDLTGVMTGDGASDQATVEHCPPFAEAMACGFLMPLACDVRVADGRVSWLWHDFPTVSARRASRPRMAFKSTEPAAGLPGHGEDMILVRFMACWPRERRSPNASPCPYPPPTLSARSWPRNRRPLSTRPCTICRRRRPGSGTSPRLDEPHALPRPCRALIVNR